MNPYMKRAAAPSIGSSGRKSEVRVSKAMGSRLQPASGAKAHAKSDAKQKVGAYKFRIESKSTVHDTLPLDVGWLSKISHEAAADASIPLLTIAFVTPEGKPRMPRNAEWVAMPLVNFLEIQEDLRNGFLA